MLITTVSRSIHPPCGGFVVAVAIILSGAILPMAAAQAPDPAQLKEAAQQRGQRAESFLRPLDTNRNGLIEASEVNDEVKRYLARTAERYGVQATFPLSIEKYRDSMIEAYIRVRGNGGPGGPPGRGPASGGGPGAGGGPGGGSVGMAQNTSSVAGFGAATPSAGTSGSSASGSSMSSPTAARTTSTGSSAVDERYRSYAANMLKRYDKNGNGALDRDEWSQLRGEWWKSADANNDGTITVDEIVARLAGYRSRFQSRSSTTTSSTTSSSSSPSSATSSSTATSSPSTAASTTSSPAPAVRKPYRFLTPTERLPAGLPDWFARKDANGDGQVTLAEFSDTLSDEVVAEFSKYDLNNDGAITPQECLKAAQGR
jgi:Ca2+-binding EF-hand superfamily protein